MLGPAEHQQNSLAEASGISLGPACSPCPNAKPGKPGKPCVTQLRGMSSDKRAVVLQTCCLHVSGCNCLIYTHKTVGLLPCAVFAVIFEKLPCNGFCDIRHLHGSVLSQRCHTN